MNSILRRFIGACAILCALGVSAIASASSPWDDLEAFETHRVAEANAGPLQPAKKYEPWGNWYAGAHVAAVVLEDTDFYSSSFEMEFEYDTGFALGGSLGYAYDFGLRLETEFTYRVTQANQLVDFLGIPFSASGNVDTLSLMLNGWFDVNFLSILFGDFVPYFGGGVGLSHAWSNVGWKGFPIVEAEDTAYVWQAGSGVAYKISDKLFFSVDYRFLRTFGKFEFDDPFYSIPIKAKYKTHNITVGFRGHF